MKIRNPDSYKNPQLNIPLTEEEVRINQQKEQILKREKEAEVLRDVFEQIQKGQEYLQKFRKKTDEETKREKEAREARGEFVWRSVDGSQIYDIGVREPIYEEAKRYLKYLKNNNPDKNIDYLIQEASNVTCNHFRSVVINNTGEKLDEMKQSFAKNLKIEHLNTH